MKERNIITGFSKLSKEDKLKLVSTYFDEPSIVEEELKAYWHSDEKVQKLFDEFGENTISNFYMPFGVAPNFLIDGKNYILPLVIEESSVIAAAAKSAKFWAENGGFHTEINEMKKIGQVHFLWKGDAEKLKKSMPELKQILIKDAAHHTEKMIGRGGGILDIELVDKTSEIEDYFQLKATFDTVDAMGANFINSCLEDFDISLKKYLRENSKFVGDEKHAEIIMSILSNYTPDCLVKCWLECDIEKFADMDENMTAEDFVWKFEKAVQVAKIDVHRATTHNKGIFNGIDAIALATGNDFRAIEACGHAYASKDGKYKSLTDIEINDGKFKYTLTIPLSMGTVGGLTSLHPLAKRSLELLGNPDAKELMRIAAAAGLSNNFGALKSLVTSGIQLGHMKMHLLNILNKFNANEVEKDEAVEYFKNNIVSNNSVEKFLNNFRKTNS
ncbi:MAG: hydroxymethylglutaryl-CoA reductase, degradative [Saprospiraceae bacterium]|nr:hydroxymethylglutaryl-CoA reductase, degradative [Saprospiraceae bacterium]